MWALSPGHATKKYSAIALGGVGGVGVVSSEVYACIQSEKKDSECYLVNSQQVEPIGMLDNPSSEPIAKV